MKAFFCFVICAAVVSSVVGEALQKFKAGTCAVSSSAKVDCGYQGVTQDTCEAKGCCWFPVSDLESARTQSQTKGTPWCFYTGPAAAGYSVESFAETATGFKGTLNLIGEGSDVYGPDLKQLSLEVFYETEDTIRVKIGDAQHARWEVPESIVSRFHSKQKPAVSNLKFSYTASPFSFEITRATDGKSLFKLGDTFTFKDQYLEVPVVVDVAAKTFGLGESTRLNHALEPNTTYTLWAADIAASNFDTNLYGSFPYYLQMVDNQAHGVMLMNSNGMDVHLEQERLTFKAIGGIVDIYVFNGPTPEAVVQQYTGIVGRPTMFPYWSLGFHNCKWGYESVQQVEDVVANYSAANIPLDTQWMDIDYMQNFRDFTYDSKLFDPAEVKRFVDGLHANGQHFVPIVDPGIMVYAGYEAYERGVREDLFIKDIKGNYYLGQVWPGPTYYPDFLHPKTAPYWQDMLQSFLDIVPADGIWIDMNEASNFCGMDGKAQVCANSAPNGCPAPGGSQTECCLVCSQIDATNQLDYPPYRIANSYSELSMKTLAMSSTQYGNVTYYDAHNLYGISEQIATNAALRTIRNKRPFVLSRSSFLSTGKHSAKWTGDNAATWDDLKSSIISVMDFNLFGVPMIGADICGFGAETNEELCARWIEAGAFYPFSRDHNAIGNSPQELYIWPTVAEAGRNALGMRYQLLPYLYSLFYAAEQTGSTVARALWVNFPSDKTAVTIDAQFMWGASVLFSPVLNQGATSVDAYFPSGYWYNFAERSFFADTTSTNGALLTLDTPLTHTNVHVRGGSILPLQEAALTTTAARRTPFTLLVALCPEGKAHGSLFWDDGEEVEHTHYLTVDYFAEVNAATQQGQLQATVTHDTLSETFVVDTVVIMGPQLGASVRATKLMVNGQALKSASPSSAHQVTYDDAKHSVTFKHLHLPLNSNLLLNWA